MGLIVYNYTTEQGFQVPELYIQVTSIRMLKTISGSTYGMVYSSVAYKSVADKDSGASPISIPQSFANVEGFLNADDFYNQTIFGFAYDAMKATWQNAGYTVADYYPQPPTPKTYIYNSSGYTYLGYNAQGFNKDGYDKNGLNAQGWDKDGYDIEGYDVDGYNRQGFNRSFLDRNGYDLNGYNIYGYDVDGYDKEGYNANGVNRNGESRPSQ